MFRFSLLLALLLWGPPAWAQRWPEAIARRLESQPILQARNLEQVKSSQGLPWEGSNSLWLLDLRDGTQAVFRSEDDPWGSQAEVAGFRLSRWLEMELVPPTVPRNLRREEWPTTTPWPFPQEVRTGSLQLYLKAQPASAALEPLERADIEVLSFIMGRYDNHSGNLLTGQDGQPVVIDFENSLELQQVRYGQMPYARRGARRNDLPSLSALQPFPFDHPQKLVNPSREDIRTCLSPWWTYWPEGMGTLYEHTQHLEDKTVHYVIWDHRLWVQVRARSRHPAWTDQYRDSTMEKLAQLDASTLQSLLPPPYSADHVRDILERAHQVLQAWRRAPGLDLGGLLLTNDTMLIK